MIILRCLLIVSSLWLSACSYRLMGMGAHREVFVEGTPRAKVIAALGPPAVSVKGRQLQRKEFEVGSADIHYTKKVLPNPRGVQWGPAAAAEMTLGLSEVILLPVIATRFLPRGTREVTVYYSSANELKTWWISRPGKGPETPRAPASAQ